MPSTFAQRFKEAVKDRKLSLRELGRRTGATGATFSNWQNEVTNPDNIGAELLRAVSSELGVRPEWLLRGEAPKHPQSYREQMLQAHRTLSPVVRNNEATPGCA